MVRYDFSEVIDKIGKATRIAVFTHVMPDGDALGSAFALRGALRGMGKQADCFLEKPLSGLYHFFPSDYLMEAEKAAAYDLKISVDCGERSRLGMFADAFYGDTINIDHHREKEPFAQINIVEEKSASTGEIIYELLCAMEAAITPKIADALYAAVATDTGGFMFSNTTADTHRITAALMEAGADFYTLNKHLLLEKTLKKYQLTALCVERMEIVSDGKIAVTYLDYDTVRKMQVTSDDLDGLSSLPRSIKGVEAGALLTELEAGKIKVSLRSDRLVDVSKVAAAFGGGGHMRASGFTCGGSIEELKQSILQKLKTELDRLNA